MDKPEKNIPEEQRQAWRQEMGLPLLLVMLPLVLVTFLVAMTVSGVYHLLHWLLSRD